MQHYIKQIPWIVVILLCITLGLAPYTSQPHIIGKLILLANGQLNNPVDIFDFLMHLSPFTLLTLKIILNLKKSGQ